MENGQNLVICGVDPGITTGWAVLRGVEVVDCGECKAVLEGVSSALDRFVWGTEAGVVVIEDFRLRPGGIGGTQWSGLSPVWVGAWIEALLWNEGWTGVVAKQMPAAAKSVMTDQKLKAMGLWKVGSVHVRDAIRHAALFQRKAAAAGGRRA